MLLSPLIKFTGYATAALGAYCLLLAALFRVRVYRFGMSMLAIGTAVVLLSIAFL